MGVDVVDNNIRHGHNHVDIEVPADPRSRHSDKDREVGQYVHPPTNTLRDVDSKSALFLRTNWQIQGFLQEQADAIERSGDIDLLLLYFFINVILISCLFSAVLSGLYSEELLWQAWRLFLFECF